MAEKRRRKTSNTIMWVILGLLILALGGFGIGGFGSSLSTVASVGDREITVQEYANALQFEINRLQQDTGQRLTLQQMQLFGLDRNVMERLLAAAALESEADRIGISVGDQAVAERIRENPAFSGVGGGFDREGYRFALQSAGLNESGYEEDIRDEAARELLQGAVAGGVEVPAAYVDAIARWIAESRDVTLATVTVQDLPGGDLAPTDADLTAFYDADPTRFETPELRAITYVWMTPDSVVDNIQIDEDQLRQLYEDRAADYRQPQRVLAERLAFADMQSATDALAAIESGTTTFDALVEERGLTLEDVDQGELSRDGLDPVIADALFALEQPGLAGPVETPLGPAIYRVNAVLDATEVPLEDVRDDLVAEAGIDAARRRIDAAREDIDDLLAGGATLEEVADQTDMELGNIRWDPAAGEEQGGFGIVAYDEFRSAARAAQAGDFPELGTLSDGGLFSLRLDEVIAPIVPPLDEIRGQVEAAWRSESLRSRLFERAGELSENPVQDIMGQPETLTGIVRDATLEGAPDGLIDRIFEAAPGDIFAFEGDDQRAFVVRVDAVTEADLSTGDGAQLRQAIETQTGTELTGDLFESYGRSVQGMAGFTVNSQAVEAVQSQLGGG
ncbi:MAG: SurA N-terminal domain-containing protein [Jannaschia helgolandensis]|uniref:Parvulin-like PPIase n=1 Tax=Jannaschia helgolandensis TaxID=188906 RepID=A0A1H7MUC3_9RHOB|nr:SurA N-terminal domain-containing protein [Jannaschia helgolandensis]SEL14880.1 peptidyl-prolyl cis-trans isomerase D [Jannaschia helgolandensis]